MMKKALILQGGWDGHEPQLTSARFAGLLEKNGYACKISDTLDVLDDLDYLMGLDLVVACWTMGEIDHKYVQNLSKAVGTGVGLTSCQTKQDTPHDGILYKVYPCGVSCSIRRLKGRGLSGRRCCGRPCR